MLPPISIGHAEQRRSTVSRWALLFVVVTINTLRWNQVAEAGVANGGPPPGPHLGSLTVGVKRTITTMKTEVNQDEFACQSEVIACFRCWS
jgi:hypothetical protein